MTYRVVHCGTGNVGSAALRGTAMHAVHAVAPVCAAAPGIRTFLDLPLLTGRHVLRSP